MPSALLRLRLRRAPAAAQLALAAMFAACLAGCAMIEPQRRQCWQDCGQTVYPNCRVDSAEVLASWKRARALSRSGSRIHDAPADWRGGKRRPAACRRELAACLELCYESENGTPTVEGILRSSDT